MLGATWYRRLKKFLRHGLHLSHRILVALRRATCHVPRNTRVTPLQHRTARYMNGNQGSDDSSFKIETPFVAPVFPTPVRGDVEAVLRTRIGMGKRKLGSHKQLLNAAFLTRKPTLPSRVFSRLDESK